MRVEEGGKGERGSRGSDSGLLTVSVRRREAPERGVEPEGLILNSTVALLYKL